TPVVQLRAQLLVLRRRSHPTLLRRRGLDADVLVRRVRRALAQLLRQLPAVALARRPKDQHAQHRRPQQIPRPGPPLLPSRPPPHPARRRRSRPLPPRVASVPGTTLSPGGSAPGAAVLAALLSATALGFLVAADQGRLVVPPLALLPLSIAGLCLLQLVPLP